MAVPFWDSLHPKLAELRLAAGGSDEPPGYEENQAANVNPWDLVVLNHRIVPGVSSVRVSPRFVVDSPKTAGEDGGTAVDQGCDAARVDISITIWTPKQWDDLQALLEHTVRKPGGKLLTKDQATAIAISHPSCALWGITAVLLESADSPEPAPQTGAMVLRLKFIQYIARSRAKVGARPVQGLTNVAPLVATVRGVVSPPVKTPAQTPPLARPAVKPRGGDTP